MPALRKLSYLFAGAALAAGLVVAGAGTAAAAESSKASTCSGGTVAPGEYGSLRVTGFCTLDGNGGVSVERNVEVTSTGTLEGVFASSRLTVGGNVIVRPGGNLALGCDPVELACFDSPNVTMSDRIGGSIIAQGAVLMVIHDDVIEHNVMQTGGGGAGSCDPVFPQGPPPYTDYALDTIEGSATVSGLNTCWDGFSHNVVSGNVRLTGNKTTIPDGNLVDGNKIGGNLSCFNLSPAPHLSDSPVKTKDVVDGKVRGQCVAISISGQD
jgi:hypothetical protein